MFGNAARSRLLPMSLPFRYFGAAAVFQVAAWLLVFLHPEETTLFEGGLGPPLAALHLLTLGVLAMAAMGASLQLLPVATRQPVRRPWAVKLAWWSLVPGIVVFAAGAAAWRPDVMGPGAIAVVLAFTVYGVLLFNNLWKAKGMRVVVVHGWAALASLAALAVSGLVLAAGYEHGLALDYAALRAAHLVLATCGFMGLLALGISNFLLPMLAVAPPPPARLAQGVLAAALAAIALAALGFTAAGSVVGLVAAVVHVGALERSLRARLRKPLGPAFVLIRASWACLLGSLVAAALGFPGGALLFGVLLVPGWLLTFVLGVLSRILPFLGSVHAARGSPMISALTPSRLLAAHCALHLAALGLLLAGAAAGSARLVQAGAAAGLAAAALFAAFFLFVVLKVRNHGIESPNQPAIA